jgi:hypothetical protein
MGSVAIHASGRICTIADRYQDQSVVVGRDMDGTVPPHGDRVGADVTGPGRYVRTEQIRAKNRASAFIPGPCADDCTCGKHRSQLGRQGHPCPAGCTCGRHERTTEHNARIGLSVALTMEAKRGR